MAKRINRTRPFVGNTRPIDYSNYKLKRKMERTNEEYSFEQKHRSTTLVTQITKSLLKCVNRND
jgi:hypothetical protein